MLGGSELTGRRDNIERNKHIDVHTHLFFMRGGTKIN